LFVFLRGRNPLLSCKKRHTVYISKHKPSKEKSPKVIRGRAEDGHLRPILWNMFSFSSTQEKKKKLNWLSLNLPVVLSIPDKCCPVQMGPSLPSHVTVLDKL
jgi:hypothetical protein